jgi:hypothetical protein
MIGMKGKESNTIRQTQAKERMGQAQAHHRHFTKHEDNMLRMHRVAIGIWLPLSSLWENEVIEI